jgi:hypothetical protein
MSEIRPPNVLVVGRETYEFDEATLTVKEPAASTAAQLAAGRLQRQLVAAWLEAWAAWLDRDREVAKLALLHWQAEPALRRQLDMEAPATGPNRAWITLGTMPAVPRLAGRLLVAGATPAFLRRWARRRLASYQRSHTRWLGGEQARWSAVREEMRTTFDVDRRFDMAKREMRQTFDDGQDIADIAALIEIVLDAVSPLLRVRELTFAGASGMALSVEYVDPTKVSDRRHVTEAGLRSVVDEGSSTARRERMETLGCLAALAITFTIFGSPDSDVAPVLRSEFRTGNLIAGASQARSAIARGNLPSVPGWSITTTAGVNR